MFSSRRSLHVAVVVAVLAALTLSIVSVTAVPKEASRVVELDASNFYDYVGRADMHVFVLFCVPWARNCQTVERLWDRLSISQSQKRHRDVFVAAKVDCEKHPELASRLGVEAYPTMKYYTPLEPTGVEYRGLRELSLLDSFVFQYT